MTHSHVPARCLPHKRKSNGNLVRPLADQYQSLAQPIGALAQSIIGHDVELPFHVFNALNKPLEPSAAHSGQIRINTAPRIQQRSIRPTQLAIRSLEIWRSMGMNAVTFDRSSSIGMSHFSTQV